MEDRIKESPQLLTMNHSRLAKSILTQNGIDKINLNWIVPDGLAAEVNRFCPVALVLMKDGTIKALDKFGRLIPFDSEWADFDCPVLAGLPDGKLFEPLPDYRVGEVITALNDIRKQEPDLYAVLAELDFSDPVFINLRTTVSHSVFRMQSHHIAEQLQRLVLVCGQEEWENNFVYDLTYKGKVIRK